jgi:hypothetical protein
MVQLLGALDNLLNNVFFLGFHYLQDALPGSIVFAENMHELLSLDAVDGG